jgi:predicted transporter
MELKTLFLGLLISLSAFAIKTGLGWAYLWSATPPNRKILASGAVAALYLFVFSSLYLLASKIDLLSHYDFFEPLWRHGITLHWLIAALLFFWGFKLLRHPYKNCDCHSQTKGWLAMVIPCPVCLSLALMSMAGLLMYFPEKAALAALALTIVFLLMALIAGLVMIKARAIDNRSIESTLGLAMMIMAFYFMSAAIILPQFSGLSRIYRLASHGAENKNLSFWPLAELSSFILSIFILSFFITRKRLKKAFS